ncbi:hypothetical protein B0O99DRAFT_622551 [Neofusicoccum parvum]|uniref:Uncharacterized protein n=1 Tax=Neofusicoccum parvum TaxID=310453 RepID=A0ACB5SEK5_9PEZI|nr:hypothetical protein B0O99DRAFT_622551 [Neofusicoccum parvum]
MRLSIIALIIGIATGQAIAGLSRRQDDAFSNFANGGDDAQRFGTEGQACEGGQGVCDAFGRCGEEIPPNEFSIFPDNTECEQDPL